MTRRNPLLPEAVTRRLVGQLTGTGPTATAYTPWTGEPLVDMPTSTAADVATAFTRARAAQARWAATPPAERARVFVRYHDLVLRNRQLMDLIQVQTGKTRFVAFEETVDVAGMALYYGRNAPAFLEPRRRKGGLPFATRVTELRHPKGVVSVISPFNYPLSDGICDVIPALMAGNGVVFKPDTQTALTPLHARELLIKAGLPAALWQIVVGEPEDIGAALVDGADHVCFTGGNAAGKRIAEAAASRLIGATMQLGGKNPMLVLADADLDKAVPAAARAAFVSGGQMCLCAERIYVHESLYRTFLGRLVAHARTMRLGAGLNFDYDIGSLSSRRQLEKVVRHVDDAVAKGATAEFGGRARPDLGPCHYEPTVLTGVTADAEIFTAETFGPVVSVYSFADEDEAVKRANATEYGLNASIWTRDLARARALAVRIKSGAVNINEGYVSTHISYDAPMGGRKASGYGRRHGEQGLLSLCDVQIVASQHGISFDPKPGVTHEQQARQVTTIYKIMKALRLR
ncbi:MAG TPA: succinic semialdehyde dehydrogenase [Actinophytocola sp.]|jgi:acyl-CoA reductase-like NAD-dependent aldehyde dehydrogenase|nr:succinic semialdehyde dehydrogenase [Actinophytocola sp.]